MKSINEFRLIDNEEIFEDIIENFKWKLEWEIINLVRNSTREEWEELINYE